MFSKRKKNKNPLILKFLHVQTVNLLYEVVTVKKALSGVKLLMYVYLWVNISEKMSQKCNKKVLFRIQIKTAVYLKIQYHYNQNNIPPPTITLSTIWMLMWHRKAYFSISVHVL